MKSIPGIKILLGVLLWGLQCLKLREWGLAQAMGVLLHGCAAACRLHRGGWA